jgi:hypothetical protein
MPADVGFHLKWHNFAGSCSYQRVKGSGGFSFFGFSAVRGSFVDVASMLPFSSEITACTGVGVSSLGSPDAGSSKFSAYSWTVAISLTSFRPFFWLGGGITCNRYSITRFKHYGLLPGKMQYRYGRLLRIACVERSEYFILAFWRDWINFLFS